MEIQSVQKLPFIARGERFLPRCEKRPENHVRNVALRIITKVNDCGRASVNVMRALARAYDIPLPPSGEKCAIYQALSSHPLWGTQPKRRFLRIPEADDAPLTHHELAYCPHISERIAALLRCTSESADVELLYSEDQMAYVRF